MSRPILLVGIGNEYRSDDGVGLVVARELQAKKLPHTLVTECSGDGAELMEMWKTADTAILVDAVSSGAKPGTIYRLDALTQPIPATFSFPSTHAFGVAEALGLARALDQLPLNLLIYAIEGKNFSAGSGLSPEVEEAVRELVERVASEVQHFLDVTNPRK
ncbi:MAG TPA: hydrogenase maturation protease [Ktedonobacteraceae bacterium]